MPAPRSIWEVRLQWARSERLVRLIPTPILQTSLRELSLLVLNRVCTVLQLITNRSAHLSIQSLSRSCCAGPSGYQVFLLVYFSFLLFYFSFLSPLSSGWPAQTAWCDACMVLMHRVTSNLIKLTLTRSWGACFPCNMCGLLVAARDWGGTPSARARVQRWWWFPFFFRTWFSSVWHRVKFARHVVSNVWYPLHWVELWFSRKHCYICYSSRFRDHAAVNTLHGGWKRNFPKLFAELNPRSS